MPTHFSRNVFLFFFSTVPVIVCPSVPNNESGSISFDSPILKNFPNPERVFITYSVEGRLIVTLPAATPIHGLHDDDSDFAAGSKTQVIAVASDSENFASCDFHYYRLPGTVTSALIAGP